MQKQHLKLSDQQHKYLTQLLAQHSLPVNTFKRASALLALHQGQTYQAVASSQQVSYPTVLTWAKRFANEQLSFLADQPRSGRPLLIQGDQRAKLTALACTKAPDGRSQWSLRLLANKAVELGYFEHLSHNQAGKILKKTNSNRILNASAGPPGGASVK